MGLGLCGYGRMQMSIHVLMYARTYIEFSSSPNFYNTYTHISYFLPLHFSFLFLPISLFLSKCVNMLYLTSHPCRRSLTHHTRSHHTSHSVLGVTVMGFSFSSWNPLNRIGSSFSLDSSMRY